MGFCRIALSLIPAKSTQESASYVGMSKGREGQGETIARPSVVFRLEKVIMGEVMGSI